MTTKISKKIAEAKEEEERFNILAKHLFSEIGIEVDDPESKTKTSFYITRLAQLMLKKLSDTYKISQGDIVNLTPNIFAAIAQRSLERRKRSVATLRTLDGQIQASIEAMKSVAPHLADLLSYPAEMISELIDLEERAVEKRVIGGLGIKKDEVQDNTTFPLYMIFINEPFESEPAYEKDIREFMGNGGTEDLFLNVLKDLFKEGDLHENDKSRTDSE